jgi:phosphatidylinositol glycan class M
MLYLTEYVDYIMLSMPQYFLWYMVLLPLYLPSSSFITFKARGILALSLWLTGQGVWLLEAFRLEFLGQSSFVPGLLSASMVFFVANVWVLGLVVSDVGVVSS